MKQRGMLAYVMICIISIVGLVNFFAPFFTEYRTDPIITYILMGTASAIAGFKGVGLSWFRNQVNAGPPEPKEEKE